MKLFAADSPHRDHITGNDPRLLVWCAALSVLLLIGTLPGCGKSYSEGAADRLSASGQQDLAGATQAASGPAITVTDRLDRQLTFTASPQRIVSLTPSITEILFGIGVGDRIVGATSHCNYPPEAKSLPRVGGGTLQSLNQEMIYALQPDLVLCKWDNHEPLLRNLERLGVPVLALASETLADLYKETAMLGRVTDHSAEAEMLISSMRGRVAAITERIPRGGGPRVFYQVWDNPLMTAGPHSFIGELLTLAGAQNLFSETTGSYPKVSPEAVVAGDPEVILAPQTHAAPVTVESILTRPGWSQVSAVRHQRVHLLNRDTISRCGPRLVDALEEIVNVLYPELPASRSSTLSPAAEEKVPAGHALLEGNEKKRSIPLQVKDRSL